MSRIVRHRPNDEVGSVEQRPEESILPGIDHDLQHSKMVTKLCWLPGRDRVVTACADGKIRLFSATTGELLHSFEGHSRAVHALCSIGEGIVVSGGDDHTLRVWDSSTARCIFSLAVRGFVKSVAALGPAGFVAGVGFDLVFFEYTRRDLWGWNGETVREIDRIRNAHSGLIYDISAHGRRFVSVSYDKMATVWDIGSHEPVARLPGHSRCVNCVAMNDRYLVTGSSDHTLRVYSTSSFDCTLVLRDVHTSNICAVVAIDDTTFASFSIDKTMCMLRLPRGAVVKRTSLPFRCRSGILLSDGRIAAGGGGSSSGRVLIMAASPTHQSPVSIVWSVPVLPSFTGTMPPSGSYVGREIQVADRVPRGVPHTVMPLLAVARRTVNFIDGAYSNSLSANWEEDMADRSPSDTGRNTQEVYDSQSSHPGPLSPPRGSFDREGSNSSSTRGESGHVEFSTDAGEGHSPGTLRVETQVEEPQIEEDSSNTDRHIADSPPDREQAEKTQFSSEQIPAEAIQFQGDRLCSVCMSAPFSGCLVPCGHCQFCFSCANELFSRGQQCPFCRNDISSVMQIYL